MPDHQDDRVEFLDPASPPVSDDEPLPAPASRQRLALVATVVLAAAVVVVLGISHVGSSVPTSESTATQRPVISVSPPASSPSGPPPTAYPVAVIRRAARATCHENSPCRVHAGDAAALAGARAALGPLRDLQVRTIGPGRARLVAALRTDGAQLLAVITPLGVRVVPTRLGITPPIAVQSQTNGGDRLIVVVSGSVDAVALLGSPRIQRWLAGLSAD